MQQRKRDENDRGQARRMLKRQRAPDFLDRRHEGRRLFAEAWGTFLLVVVAAGGGVISARSGGAVTLAMAVVAPALMVMAIIYFMGTVSGAHLNPAVTLAFAVRRNFPWNRVPGYIVAQVVGGVLAAVFLRLMFGTQGALGATVPGHQVTQGTALAMEILLTTGLVSTILGTAAGARNVGVNGALAVGGYIALAGLWAAPISGSSMNPVRSFAPDLIRGDLSTTWVYVVGPVTGAMIGVLFEWILKGPPTAKGMRAAEGSPITADLNRKDQWPASVTPGISCPIRKEDWIQMLSRARFLAPWFFPRGMAGKPRTSASVQLPDSEIDVPVVPLAEKYSDVPVYNREKVRETWLSTTNNGQESIRARVGRTLVRIRKAANTLEPRVRVATVETKPPGIVSPQRAGISRNASTGMRTGKCIITRPLT